MAKLNVGIVGLRRGRGFVSLFAAHPRLNVTALCDLNEATLSEIQTVTQRCLALLRAAYNPEGFNIGINIGSAAGAGLADHVHQHIVPRWAGDTNFMTTLAETRVIPQALEETYAELHALWLEKFPDQKAEPR